MYLLALKQAKQDKVNKQFNGPSDSAIPNAFPPFLLKWEMMSLVRGWNTTDGTMDAASLMAETSSMKIERIS